MKIYYSLTFFFILTINLFADELNCKPAFPGAEGFGACAKGGRGGKVLKVTTLKDDGSVGSLRWAIERSSGPRIVEFDVGGVISLNNNIRIENPYVTIDGSTAPYPGITLKDGTLTVRTNDVIIRYIKVRPGDEAALGKGIWKQRKRDDDRLPSDAISVDKSKNVILDHVSTSWSADEVLSVTDSENVTVQWSIITEPLSNPKVHKEGKEQVHAFGSLINGTNISYIKNVVSNFANRGPQLGVGQDGSFAQILVANNIIAFYSNWGTKLKLFNDKEFHYAIFNNVYISPLDKNALSIDILYSTEPPVNKKSKIFINNNILHDKNKQKENDWYGVTHKDVSSSEIEKIKAQEITFSYSNFRAFPPEVIVKEILPTVGASLPKRDSIDERVLEQIKTRKGGKIIFGQDDVGGYENISSDSGQTNKDEKDDVKNDGNSLKEIIVCESKENKYVLCEISNKKRPLLDANLLKQYSKKECVKNKNFGLTPQGLLFVMNGCKGEFEVVFEDIEIMSTERVFCESKNFRLTGCQVPNKNAPLVSVKLVEQKSNIACVKGASFGLTPEGMFFVNIGCAGVFEVGYGKARAVGARRKKGI